MRMLKIDHKKTTLLQNYKKVIVLEKFTLKSSHMLLRQIEVENIDQKYLNMFDELLK